MYEIMEIKDRNLVIQHNDVVEARYKLSLEEQRLMKILISMLDRNDEEGKTYFIRVADIAELLDLKGEHIYHTVKRITARLIKQVLFIKRGDGELQVSWLSSAEYLKGGIVELEISKKLRPYLLELNEYFTKYQLRQIAKLKSVFSIRIYELCKSHQYRGSFVIEVDAMKRMFGIEEKYKLYGDFKRKVLTVAKEEIAQSTDILIDFRERKDGKKVVSLEFIIQEQEQPQFEDSEFKSETDVINPIIKRLLDLGVTKNAAANIVNEYDEERINNAIDYTQAQQKEGKIKNPAGFVVEAIKNEYRDNHAEAREREKKALQEADEHKARIARFDGLKKRYAEAKNGLFEKWHVALNAEDLAAHREKYLSTLPDSIRHKKKSVIVEKGFLAYLKSLLPFPSLREWALQSAIDISEFEVEIRQYEG